MSRRPSDRRISFIDNARAIGIVLVVLGHAPSLPAYASNVIFAFHMPMFFFLSGLVVSRDRLAMSSLRRAVLLSKSLLVPYVFYFGVAYLYWIVAKRHGLRSAEFEALPWWNPVFGLLSGRADDLYVDVVLWFFPCLFLTAMAHHVLSRLVAGRVVAGLLAIVTVVFVLTRDPAEPSRWWWSADCALVAIGFYAVGSACNDILRHSKPFVGRTTTVAVALVACLACLWTTRVNGHVDLNHLSFGRTAILYVPMAVSGIVMVLAAAALLGPSAIGRWLSVNTLVIFPVHFLLFSVFTGIAIEVFGLSPLFKEATSATSIVYTVCALALCWPIAIALNRFAPWLFHRRRMRSAGPHASLVVRA